MDEKSRDGWLELAVEIVWMALRDYKRALRYFKRHGMNGSKYCCDMVYLKRSCEQFFRSQWFEILCDIDGELLIRESDAIANMKDNFRSVRNE